MKLALGKMAARVSAKRKRGGAEDKAWGRVYNYEKVLRVHCHEEMKRSTNELDRQWYASMLNLDEGREQSENQAAGKAGPRAPKAGINARVVSRRLKTRLRTSTRSTRSITKVIQGGAKRAV